MTIPALAEVGVAMAPFPQALGPEVEVITGAELGANSEVAMLPQGTYYLSPSSARNGLILDHFSIYAPPGHTAEIDARLRDNSQDEMLARFKDIDIGATDFPLRPDYGTEGRAVTLRTNYYSMSIPGPFYEYEVVIAPTTSTKRVKRRIFELAEDTQDWKATLAGSVAHDHSAKLVARKELPQPLTIRVPFYDEDEDPPARGATASKEYTLAIKFIQELETESLKRLGAHL